MKFNHVFSKKFKHRRRGSAKRLSFLRTRRFTALTIEETRIVQEFKQAVLKRPADVAWLIRYGSLARSMGLTYPEALAVVKRHIRKLRGNTRLIWIDQGLRTGYDRGA